jgi:hypothetical protein
MLQELYLHPSGQLPAYEWNFSDVKPPVHAWATLFLYRTEEATIGKGDVDFLKRSFNRLLTSFTWWLNQKDRSGNNAFEGGFLGLDNIGVFDRSAPLPMGGCLEQADGTAWMSLFRALLQFYEYHGDNFQIECPTGSGKMMTLFEVAQELARGFQSIFLKDAAGRRPVFGGAKKFQTDSHWRDHLLFYEYVHGDNGAGLGASHQTGWTGLVAPAIYAHEW